MPSTTSSSTTSPTPPAAERRARTAHSDVTVLCLSLRALAEIGVVARVDQPLAGRGLFPSGMPWQGTAEQLLIDLQITGVSEREGAILAESLRQVVGIDEVLTSRLLRQRAA